MLLPLLLALTARAGTPFDAPTHTSLLEADRIGHAAPDLGAPTPLTDAQATRAATVLAAARTHLGATWRWGGRNTTTHPGIDCLGLLFLADGAVSGRSWRAFEVNPSELVAGGKLGLPAAGLDGVLRAELPVSHLMPGDVLYFLRAGYRIDDKPLLVRGTTEYWPWHTGLWAGEGQVLHSEPGGEVRSQPLEEVRFDALFVTRQP